MNKEKLARMMKEIEAEEAEEKRTQGIRRR